MPRRIQPTLFDYMIVAINPALIMILIGSLVYFLLEMFYQGQYPERLHFCLSMFVLGAVLIARISMAEGWEHAAPFGIALAVVISLAMHRFVSYQGTTLNSIGWLINYALIALAWWCAHQLTWDCTLIDENQDASGEGLLQTVGLDSGAPATDKVEQSATDSKGPKNRGRDKKSRATESIPPTDSILPASADRDPKKSWWQKFLERRRRPHAPGVWVIYFSLAALPIFGFGQAFIPAANTASRRYAFLLICAYVASALGLLLTTSFLGLRRYLRQRRLEMPLAMAGTWLVTGAVLIACILLLTALLPRPNAEYAISELPFSVSSEEHDSSKMSVGREGTKDDQARSGSGKHSRPENQKIESEPNQDGSGVDKNRPGQSGAQSDQSKDGQSKTQSKSGDPNPAKSNAGKPDKGEKSADGKTPDSKNSSQGQSPDSSDAQSSESKQSESKGDSQDQSQQNTSQPSVTPPDLSGLGDSLMTLFKWVFYGAIIVLALVWAWRHRAELLAWLMALLTGWSSLFGRRKRPAPEMQLAAPQKSFLDFTDPFTSGMASRASPEELVRYTFEAFEAWARDNGCPREQDHTAYEFARQVGARAEHLAKPARVLAELYSCAAYSPASLPTSTREHLQVFWQSLQAEWSHV